MYTAAVGSMDSWDMENLKYLRKISRSNQATGGTNAATESYSSQNCDALLVSDEEFLHLENHPLSITSANTNYSASTVVSVTQEENIVAPLDNCYVLDIVTVRNESVLANRITSVPNSKSLLGSDGYESSSAESSLDESKLSNVFIF